MAVKTKKTVDSKISDYLGRVSRPKTALEIAGATKSQISTVRTTLRGMIQSGTVKVVGTVKNGQIGRPAQLYTLR